MELCFDRAYYEARLARALELANSATIPSIRKIHLIHASHYEAALNRSIKRSAPARRTLVSA